MRVSRSGGWTSTHSPHRNRLTSRSSSPESSCGGRSDAIAICLAAGVEVVERVEELGLGLLALGEELDVVHEQDVHLAVALAEPVALALADRLDELGHELLGRHVLDPDPRVEPVHVVTDRDQEVGLAQTHAAVDEQRVVRRGGRRLGDGHGRGVGEPVDWARARTRRTCSWGTADRARRPGAAGARRRGAGPARVPRARRWPSRTRAVGTAGRRPGRRSPSSTSNSIFTRSAAASAAASSISREWLCCSRSRTSALGHGERRGRRRRAPRAHVGEPHDDRGLRQLGARPLDDV